MAALVPAALFPLLLRPEWIVALAACLPILWLASRSVAYPLGLLGLPTVVIGAIGSNPIPRGAITVVIFTWIVAALGFAVAKRDNPPAESVVATPVFVFSFALLILMIARLGYSAAESYGASKVEFFVIDNLTVLIAGAFVGWRLKHFDLFLLLTLLVAAAGAIVLLKQFLSGQAQEVFPGRFAVSAYENPIALGRESATGLIIAIYLVLAAAKARLRLLALTVAPVLAVALLSAGSRGPILGFVVGLVTLLFLTVGDPSNRRRLRLLVVGLVASVVLVSSVVPGETIGRSLSVVTGSESGLSSTGRSDLWSEGYEAFADHPLGGLGTGGFSSLNVGEVYPHNLLVEVGAELGILGLILFVGALFAAVRMLAATRRSLVEGVSTRASLVIALFVMAVANSMLSGDIPTNSSLWLAMGVGLGLSAQRLEAKRLPFAWLPLEHPAPLQWR